MKRFLFRACLGMIIIYGVNQFLISEDIALHVGLNGWTFLTTGFLGVPGVALLYGIVAFGFL